MIDAKRYLRLKDQGLTKINGEFLEFSRFDIETGKLSDPEQQKINIDEINTRKEELQKELDGINYFLKAIHDLA